jgi:hypothetical protein
MSWGAANDEQTAPKRTLGQTPSTNHYPHDDGPCGKIASFLSARTGKDRNSFLQPKSGVTKGSPCILPKDLVNVLIATVPNPLDTNLALWFDRAIESIENAAGSVGFRFQEAWIPWDTDLVRDEPDIFKRTEQDNERTHRERAPGALLFRSSKGCGTDTPECQYRDLIVLLVPETPTAGIEPEVFTDAVKMVVCGTPSECKSNGDRPIPVLGPSFSGSIESLLKIIQKPNAQALRVISGTVGASDEVGGRLDAALLKISTARNPSREETLYSKTVHSFEDQFRVFEDAEKTDLTKGRRIALLSESDTQLGWSTKEMSTSKERNMVSHQENIFYYRFPREISRLRNAYTDQELRAIVGSQQQSPTFRDLLRFRLFNVGPDKHSTPVLATNQTPLSQDGVLEQIARTVEADRVDMLGILATDIFDALFIARYFRDACPDIRLFAFDSDVLYPRAAEDFPLAGTIAVGDYPLIPPNQIWTNPDGSEGRRLFASRPAEGIYNAIRALLVESSFVSKDYASKPLAEYLNPATCSKDNPGCKSAPVWITVVGRSGYWPISVQDVDDTYQLHWSGQETPGPSSPKFGLGAVSRMWQLFLILVVSALLWHFGRVVFACCDPASARSRGFSHLTVLPAEEHCLAHLCYLLIYSAGLAAFYTTYVAPFISIRNDLLFMGTDLKIALICLFALFTLLIFTPFYRLLFKGPKSTQGPQSPAPPRAVPYYEWGKSDRFHWVILFLAFLFILVFSFLLYRIFWAETNNQKQFFLAYRSLHLTNGVSPVVPILILLAGYLGWARVHLRRVVMVQERLMKPPAEGSDDVTRLRAISEKSTPFINGPMPLHWRTLAAGLIVAAICVYMQSAIRSFEYEPYDRLFLWMLAILYGLLFLTWTRFLEIWWKFKEYLAQLDRHPLREAFITIPRKSVFSPLLQFTTADAEYTVLTAIRERFKSLKTSTFMEWSKEECEAIERAIVTISYVLDSSAAPRQLPRFQAEKLQDSLREANRIVIKNLESVWAKGPSQPSEKQDDPATSPDNLREEILAFQYADHIQYVLHQQRNLLMFVIIGFVLSIVALHSYPFQKARTISTFVTIMFVVLASGISIVMAQAERDPVLSRIMKTTPGELNSGFFVRIFAYLGFPLITVLSSQFPSIGRFLFSWVAPMLDALK